MAADALVVGSNVQRCAGEFCRSGGVDSVVCGVNGTAAAAHHQIAAALDALAGGIICRCCGCCCLRICCVCHRCRSGIRLNGCRLDDVSVFGVGILPVLSGNIAGRCISAGRIAAAKGLAVRQLRRISGGCISRGHFTGRRCTAAKIAGLEVVLCRGCHFSGGRHLDSAAGNGEVTVCLDAVLGTGNGHLAVLYLHSAAAVHAILCRINGQCAAGDFNITAALNTFAAGGLAGLCIHSRAVAGEGIRTVCHPHQRLCLETIAAGCHCGTAVRQLQKALCGIAVLGGLYTVIAGSHSQICAEHCHAVLALYTILCRIHGDRTIHQFQRILADNAVPAVSGDRQAAAAVDRQLILCKQSAGIHVVSALCGFGVVGAVCQNVFRTLRQ